MTRISFSHRSLIAAATGCIAGTAGANVLIVDPGGAGTYTQISAAVSAAVDGDTILVKPGYTYTGFTVDGKSLSIVGDGPAASLFVSGLIRVRNLQSGQTVVLSNLTVTGATASGGSALVVELDQGFVRASACSFEGATGNGQPSSCSAGSHDAGWPAVDVSSSSGGVAFADCTFVGGPGVPHPYYCYDTAGGDGAAGLLVAGTSVALYDCHLTGGRGGDGSFNGGAGGTGARVDSGPGLFASHTAFTGGRGGDGEDFTVAGGVGGDAIYAAASVHVQTLGCTTQAGMGGFYAPDGQAHGGAGVYFEFNVPFLQMSAPSVARESTSLSLVVNGQPGDAVYLFSSHGTAFHGIPSWRGVLLTQNAFPTRIMILGTIPASGTLNVSVAVPDLGAGVAARDAFLQVYRSDATGSVTLGSFGVVTLLDGLY